MESIIEELVELRVFSWIENLVTRGQPVARVLGEPGGAAEALEGEVTKLGTWSGP